MMNTQVKRGLALTFLLTLLLTLAAAFPAQAAECRISGRIWLDKTADGVMNREDGVANVQVILEQKNAGGSETQLASVKTDKQGDYSFSVAAAGEYRLRIEAADDMYFTLYGESSAALPAQDHVSVTPWFQLADGDSVEKNIGLTRSTCYFSFIAFEDENANGGRMNSEPLLRGVRLEVLYENEGQTYVVASGETDRDGSLTIRHLSPGTYRIRAIMPEPYVVGPIGLKINTFYNCFQAGTDNTGLSEPITLAVKESVGMGVSGVKTGSLSGRLWMDANANGQWDAGEGGLTSAAVSLVSATTSAARQTSADANGNYAFRNLPPDNYRLIVTLPDGMIFTSGTVSRLTSVASQGELNVSVQVETNASVGDIGAINASSLSFTLYEDVNMNGVKDLGEMPLPGAMVTVVQGSETVASLQTGLNLPVSIQTLRSGTATISCTLPDGYVFTQAADNVFSNAQVSSTANAAIELPGGEPVECQAGAVRASAISGLLFEDAQNTGVYGASSSPVPGMTVQAIDINGLVTRETITDSDGRYTLSPLLPGVYAVRFLLEDPFVAAAYALESGLSNNQILSQTPDYGQTGMIPLQPGMTAASINGGVFRAGVVEGYVYADGGLDAQGGVPGILVTLRGTNGEAVSEYTYDTTDAAGHYLIKGVMPGAYFLSYALPDDVIFTSPTAGDVMQSDQFVVSSGSEITMPALNAIQTASLAGTVLADQLGTPVLASLALTSQSTGARYEAAVSENGTYAFSGLLPDLYLLQVVLPQGYVFSDSENSLMPAVASNSASLELTLISGQHLTEQNIFAAPPVSFSGCLFLDANLSGERDAGEPAAENRTFRLLLRGQEIATATTDAEGRFENLSLAPGVYTLSAALDDYEVLVGGELSAEGEWQIPISLTDGKTAYSQDIPIVAYATLSGHVWNLDGTYNNVSGLPVSLIDANGVSLGTAITDAQGGFGFTGLLPGGYSFSTTLPNGFIFAREQDAAKRQSLIQSLTNGSAVAMMFDVAMGDDLTGMDIGFGAIGGIGDSAWLDENGNGLQDIGEPPMPGIVIELYQYGQLIASTITDGYGHYALDDLFPGEYEMHVTMPSELKSTACRTDFPLAASVLPQSEESTVTAVVTVPSGSKNLHCDLGFQLRQEGVYPANMNQIPVKEWVPYSNRAN